MSTHQVPSGPTKSRAGVKILWAMIIVVLLLFGSMIVFGWGFFAKDSGDVPVTPSMSGASETESSGRVMSTTLGITPEPGDTYQETPETSTGTRTVLMITQPEPSYKTANDEFSKLCRAVSEKEGEVGTALHKARSLDPVADAAEIAELNSQADKAQAEKDELAKEYNAKVERENAQEFLHEHGLPPKLGAAFTSCGH